MAKRVAAKSAKVNGQTAIERAQARATAAGLPIIGRGWRVSDGALAWAVPSQSEPGKRHMVVLVGDTLLCGCKGSANGRVCIHQGVVYNELAAEARAWQAAQRTQTAIQAAAKPSPAITPRSDADRASAPLARDNRPFSIWR